MPIIFRAKLRRPVLDGYIPRPRLLADTAAVNLLIAQAPSGAGKTAFLAQWLTAAGRPAVYYRLDDQDRDPAVFTAHLLAGLRDHWPDWLPAVTSPRDLAVELVNEAEGRPPLVLALDQAEAAFGQAYLADFLAVLARYAPPSLTLALATRAPLPIDLPAEGLRLVRATDLAFTADEAGEWLGQRGGWRECHGVTAGLPLALELWRRDPTTWRPALLARLTGGAPPHLSAETARALTEDWLAGQRSLAAYSHQVSCGQPGAEQLWAEVQEARRLYAAHPPAARVRLDGLWETARGRGDRPLMGAVALLQGEVCLSYGDYGQAMDWYRQSFEADPTLELAGAHSMVLILRDQGHVDEAEALARRCLAARQERGDLLALGLAHIYYGCICMERERLDEAETAFLEAERLGHKLAADPLIGILAIVHRALLQATRGDFAAFRRLAESAYALAHGRWPWFEALCGHVLASALVVWNEQEQADRLMAQSLAYLSAMPAKWHLHVLRTVLARRAWQAGQTESARQQFDHALALAAREGYVQYLQSRRAGALPLVLDALSRGSEVTLCQELLVRMGDRALPSLLSLASHPNEQARRSAIYPLAALGGEKAVAAIRTLLHDGSPLVRDGAVLALRSAGGDTSAPPPAPPAGQVLSAALLGPLVVSVRGRPVEAWRTSKARDLLAFLLLAGHRPVTRDQLLEALWPESDPADVQPLLHTSLYYLRRTLQPEASRLIIFAGGVYRLDRECVDLDLDRFRKLAATANPASWQEAVMLYRGDLLEGLDYPWCEGPRAQAREAYLSALRRLASHHREEGRPGEAIPLLHLLTQTDPFDEGGHVSLMECYAAQGNRSAALQQYRTLARHLDEELGLEPGPKAQELYRSLLG